MRLCGEVLWCLRLVRLDYLSKQEVNGDGYYILFTHTSVYPCHCGLLNYYHLNYSHGSHFSELLKEAKVIFKKM